MLKYFTKADSLLDVGQRWWPVLGVVWLALSWVFKQMTALGTINWPEAVIIGFFTTLLLMLVISIGLVAIRIFRPVKSGETDSKTVVKDDPNLKNELRSLHTRTTSSQDKIAAILPILDGLPDKYASRAAHERLAEKIQELEVLTDCIRHKQEEALNQQTATHGSLVRDSAARNHALRKLPILVSLMIGCASIKRYVDDTLSKDKKPEAETVEVWFKSALNLGKEARLIEGENEYSMSEFGRDIECIEDYPPDPFPDETNRREGWGEDAGKIIYLIRFSREVASKYCDLDFTQKIATQLYCEGEVH
ncbi:hypothetical protein [Pontixanthobacter sp.]|uniref:hypothetical protein n=1 Tax=Pontixanthobacter sp. TaxID=2792078 RepID=UPI003C7E95CD